MYRSRGIGILITSVPDQRLMRYVLTDEVETFPTPSYVRSEALPISSCPSAAALSYGRLRRADTWCLANRQALDRPAGNTIGYAICNTIRRVHQSR
jgi:hypothetical protein